MRIEERKTFRKALCFCLVLLSPFLFLAFYSWPIADDLTYAFKGQNSPFWEGVFNEYKNWNGRYFSNVLVLHNPFGYGSILLYRLVPIALIFGIAFSARHYFQSLFKNAFNFRSYWIGGFLFCLLFLFTMPDISEGIYWYTGSVSYTLGAILLLFSFSFHLRKRTFLSLIFLFLGMGCSEVCMLFGLLYYFVQHFVFKSKNGVLLIAAVLFAAAVYFAPGNAIRSALFDAKHQLFHSIIYSVAQTARFNLSFLGLAVILTSIIWVYNLEKLSERSIVIRNSFGMTWKNSWLLLLVPIFISAFPAYWSTGILGQHRTINVACFFWIFAWFANLTVWFNALQAKSLFRKKIFAFGLIVFLIPNFIVRKDHFQLLSDIIEKRYETHSNVMEERWKRMENCKKLNEGALIYLPIDSSQCKTLDVLPLYEPEHWMNEGYAIFCGCEHVRIKKE